MSATDSSAAIAADAGEGHHLEPADWEVFGKDMHALLDQCLDRMKNARDTPWVPKPQDLRETMALTDIRHGRPASEVFDRLTGEIMPYATGNTHPRFWGWVHGTGLPIAVGAEMVAASMNSNCGGRDHAAAEVERAVIDWLVSVCGISGCLPRLSESDHSFGALVSGTSQATILAFCCARRHLFGVDVRKSGIRNLDPVRVYAVSGAHSCMHRALEVLGHGSDALQGIASVGGKMCVESLKAAVLEDLANGIKPMAVVATAGTVNLGEYDDFVAIGAFCQEHGIWLHIDSAFGFWLTLSADPAYHALTAGMDTACSIALDFHKWMGIPYDCGAFLCYSEQLQKSTFSSRPAYLQQALSSTGSGSRAVGIAGGDLWMCDYTLELSRGFRALKVWTSLQAVGTDTFGAVITENCQQASYMAELVERSPHLALARPVVSNVCCFWPRATATEGEGKIKSSAALAAALQLAGTAVFSTTAIDGEECLRAAIVNQRTTRVDVEVAVAAVEALLQ